MAKLNKEQRILVADDDPSVLQLLCTIVKRVGLHVDCVPDGEAAVEHLKEHEYSVILLDLMMPRLDGFGVIEYLKNNPPHYKPVVLVITAYADQKFKDVDPNIVAGVLRKPFDVAEVGNLVRNCVDGLQNIRKTPMTLGQDDETVRIRVPSSFSRDH